MTYRMHRGTKASAGTDTSKPIQSPRGLPGSNSKVPNGWSRPGLTRDVQYDSEVKLVDKLLGTKEAVVDWDKWTWDGNGNIVGASKPKREDKGVRTEGEDAGNIDDTQGVMNTGDADGREVTEKETKPDIWMRLNTRFLLESQVYSKPNRTHEARIMPEAGGRPRIKMDGTVAHYVSRAETFKERLFTMFGEGSISRGSGGRPRRQRQQVSTWHQKFEQSVTWGESSNTSEADVVAEQDAAVSETEEADLELQGDGLIILGKRGRKADEMEDAVIRELKRSRMDVVIWILAVQRLVKGKARVDEEGLRQLSEDLSDIEKGRCHVTSELAEVMVQLSELNEIPFGDMHRLRDRAWRVVDGWTRSSGKGAMVTKSSTDVTL